MNKKENELTPKQEKALAALLSEPTATAAAETANVALSTLMRWLNEPAFAAAYKMARGRILETTLIALQSASGQAVTTLRNVLTDETARAGEKVSAAKAIIEFALKAREVLEVEERLKALESLLAQTNQNQKGVA